MNVLDIISVDSVEYTPVKATESDAGYDLRAKILSSDSVDKHILNNIILYALTYVKKDNTPNVYLNGTKLFEFEYHTQDDIDKLYQILDDDNYTILSPPYCQDPYISSNICLNRNMSPVNTGVRLNLEKLRTKTGVLPCALVLPRSGWAYKHQISVVNSPGLIDPGYIGEVKVLLENRGHHFHIITDQTRIAQLVFMEVLDLVGESNGYVRGAQGFGSSGV